MNRGFLGSMPAATERDDEAYLDFVEGVRIFNASKVGPLAAAQRKEIAGRTFGSAEDLRSALSGGNAVATNQRIYRTSQEMMWQGVIETYGKRGPELLAELDRYDRMGPGSVEWDPKFQYPAYFDHVEFHIQPGNYHADPLAGYIYHYGTKVFFTGRNNNDDVQRDLVMMSPTPSDGQVRRVLDIGCSCGQATTAFKERYPQAECWGIDIGAPMVRYAHKRAVDMGCDVHFKQALSENTGFADGSFDIVFAFILFHEIPLHIGEQTVREAHRLLRPGGLFICVDFITQQPRTAMSAMRRDDNGEPYAGDYTHSDFHGLLRREFRTVNESYTPKSFLPMRVAEK